ncbi:MAG: hypothetical protein J1E96_05170 [Ruminococcus sp.]|nr:hypothetical protein [Ruminococcus sp.]
MNIKTFFKAISIKARRGRVFSRKFVKSYVSLFVVLILGVTSTFAWFTQKEDAEIRAKDLEFQSASSLRINKDKSVSNNIKIEDFVLDEASSVDGRNIYFPLGASFTEDTANMFFREGNKGDENQRYVYKDFELKGTSGNTPVYIKAYKITVGNDVYEDELVIEYQNGVPVSQDFPKDCPIRLAFIADSGDNPVVIDPSAMVIDYVENSDAVTLIDDDGNPMLERTATDSFASYYYGNTPLFVIPGGQNLPVTLVIWLEGSLGNCDEYIGKKISVDIEIESNFAEMEAIMFVDDTEPDDAGGQKYWVSNENPIIACSYKDPYSSEGRWKTVIMSRVSNDKNKEGYRQWTAELPKKAVTDIVFFRLNSAGDGSKQGTIYNSWRTTANINDMLNQNISNSWFRTNQKDLQGSRQWFDSDGNKYNSLVYTAVHGNGHGFVQANDPDIQKKRLSPCVGYWDYKGGSGGTGGGNTGATEATTSSSSGGDNTGSSTYQIGVSLQVSGDKMWLYNNVENGDQLWINMESGKSFQIKTNGYGKFEGTFTMDAGDSIVTFGLKNPGASNYYTTLSLSPSYKITQNYNVTFKVNNNNTISVQ